MSKSQDKRVAALRGRDLVGALIQAACCNGAGPCPDLRREQDAAEQALRAELDGLRKDAERYRWLTDMASPGDGARIYIALETKHGSDFLWGMECDERIDAAMRGEG